LIPTKAYIIRISSEVSQEYAQNAAKSCERLGIPYEFFEGTEKKTAYDAWMQSGLTVKMFGLYKSHKIDGSACATVSHALIWKKIVENKECAIILEHDALMLHKLELDIPDNSIVVLGYKVENPKKYEHLKAGPPVSLISIDGHEGAHAYALTWKTAEVMLDELNTSVGVCTPIDNSFFLKMRKSKTVLQIADPTPAIGWVRTSTIWPSSSIINYPFIDSFKNNYGNI
jgi:hypothetical protein